MVDNKSFIEILYHFSSFHAFEFDTCFIYGITSIVALMYSRTCHNPLFKFKWTLICHITYVLLHFIFSPKNKKKSTVGSESDS